jgi:hypothetical protein
MLHRISISAIDVVLDPSTFVQSKTSSYGQETVAQLWIMGKLTGFYIVNLLLYAGPLTLAGFGVTASQGQSTGGVTALLASTVPSGTSSSGFFFGLALNSTYLFIISALTFVTFHIGIWLTRNSKGLNQTLHTVVYSTGIYLAVIFTLTWYLSTSGTIAVADQFLIQVQKEFIYLLIDLFGADLGLPGGRPTATDLSRLTMAGKVALGGLALSLLYFLYSLYLGARINHHAGRFDSFIVVVFVGLSPAVYVGGSILLSMIGGSGGL